MTHLKTIEDNLKKDDRVLLNNLNSDSLKQFVSKFTFLLSTLPPFIIVLLISLLQWKLLYAFIIIALYHILLYWVIEAKFNLLIHFAQKTKDFILPYIQKLQNL